MCFIAEVPPVESFVNSWDAPKTDTDDKAQKVHQDEKFLYKEDFGENLVGKMNPAIFVFSILDGSLIKVDHDLGEKLYPAHP